MRDAAILAFVAALLGGVVAFLAALRQRDSIPKWSFVVGMAVLALESLFSGMAAHTDLGSEVIEHWQQWRLGMMSLVPGFWLLFSLTYARGNARAFLSRWGYLLGLAFLLPIVLVLLFHHDLIWVEVSSLEPGLRRMRLNKAGLALAGIFLLTAVLVLMNFERTFRASVGVMRWRIKFTIMGLSALFAERIYTSSQALLWPKGGIEESVLTLDSMGLILGCVLLMRPLFRRQEEATVYPSFALFQNSFVPFLAGIYLMIVGLLAKIIQWIGRDASFQEKAFFILIGVVAVTIVAWSDRARLYTRRFLSRYLQRPLYDYRTVWRSFTVAITSRVKPEELCDAAAKKVAEIFQALSVTIWLLDDKRENLQFAASTSLSQLAGKELKPTREESGVILKFFQDHSEPRDIESSRDDWAVALRRCTPMQFRTGGSRVCVPMTAGGQVMGVMMVGDRVSAMFFSLQDFDLLKCVGDQMAAGLLTAQLSQKLLQAKELEAFQTMSAFFVHDLKNTASTLNLMLKNLPVHFDNPAFREDALRGVAKTCDHINHLITRLGLLRHDLQINPAEVDLSELTGRVLTSWNGASDVTFVKNLRPCAKVLLDREQITKVVTNLVLNATEAVAKGGKVTVETAQNNGWTVLTVSDNGCGMDSEFLRRALFRPFQTTKKNGFGIGMFQSKMIVEAHGGRIEVESELKKGTTFRVLLPAQKSPNET